MCRFSLHNYISVNFAFLLLRTDYLYFSLPLNFLIYDSSDISLYFCFFTLNSSLLAAMLNDVFLDVVPGPLLLLPTPVDMSALRSTPVGIVYVTA